MDKPNEEVEEKVSLFERPEESDEGTDTGVLTLKIQWVPSKNAPKRKKPIKDHKGDELPAGELHVTAVEAHDLRHPDAIIRDLSTFVDFTAVYLSLSAIAVYIMISFAFYRFYMMSSADEDMKELLDRLHGGNGDWDNINTLVFLFTSFTTVGYGNHPSLVFTQPPCQYPSLQTSLDNERSVLLPPEMVPEDIALLNDVTDVMGVSENGVAEEIVAWSPPAKDPCFMGKTANTRLDLGAARQCWAMSDEESISISAHCRTTRRTRLRRPVTTPRSIVTQSSAR